MTEDEAKTKWCPHVRYTSGNGEGINRWVTDRDEAFNPLPSRCIGSECMSWRWDTDAWTLAFDDKGPLTRRKDFDEPQGFCGLAGRP